MARDYKNYRTHSDAMVDYFKKRPEEIEPFLSEIFTDYAEDNDSGALLSQLRVVARASGISAMAKEIGISRKGLQIALSDQGNPNFDNVSAIMNSMGYHLIPQRNDAHPK